MTDYIEFKKYLEKSIQSKKTENGLSFVKRLPTYDEAAKQIESALFRVISEKK